ncbi:Chitin deacetylase [Choanephora cucurbitarum]|uniref:Chitin deacetylase n=1 Tax=Choanephora cucurbitarum TaxID=101091 RepID=A0A1C7N5K1_9FUNG|nr:Chitin deacetylase [Choanephora cucurbitarum]
MKFISIAAVLSLISVIQAQNTTATTKESYPADGSKPVPKPEWLELIKNANITNAPVLKSQGSDGPSTSGPDNYCDWAKSGCVGTSIAACPKGMWGLTFDDGPSNVSPVLYDFLKTTNQKATLFMIGSNVIKYPQTVKRAYDEGHEIAIHTWTHSYMTTLTNEQIVAELKWTELAIKEIIGVSPRLFRPPYGDIDNRVRDIGTALGFTSVIWNHDTNDWMLAENYPGFKASYIDGNFTEWINEAKTASSGGLSLEHDILKPTVDAAIKNLPNLQKAYNVVTVGQCAGVSSYKESNATAPVNATSSAVSSAVSSAASTSSAALVSSSSTAVAAAVTSAAPSNAQNSAAAVAAGKSSMATSISSSNALLTSTIAAAFGIAFYMT